MEGKSSGCRREKLDCGAQSRQPQRGQQKADVGLEKSQGVERKGPKRGMYEIEGEGEEPKGVGSSLKAPPVV